MVTKWTIFGDISGEEFIERCEFLKKFTHVENFVGIVKDVIIERTSYFHVNLRWRILLVNFGVKELMDF